MMPNRRSVLAGAGLSVAALPAWQGVAATPATDWAVEGLLVDGLVEPRGLHAAKPRLSWRAISDRRGARQSAWRVGVASSRQGAVAGRYDIWDSGRVAGAKCFDVVYDGPRPVARQQLFWRVTAWDERGAEASGPVSSWEMGLLDPADWSATWLAAETTINRDDRTAGFGWHASPAAQKDAVRAFRLAFALPEAAEVTVMSGCDTLARVFLDGRKIIDPAPNGWGIPGPFTETMPLAPGRHVFALEAQRGDAAVVRAAVLIRATFADGRIVRFDASGLRTAIAPAPGWRSTAFDDNGWVRSAPVDGQSPMPAHAATLLRRSFKVEGRIASARLYATALGVYEAEVNGRPIGDALLRPEFTDYRRHCLYCVEDVADRLVQGENVLGFHVGDGWYGSYIAPNGRFSFGPGPLRIMGQLEIRYADGRVQTVATGDGWSVSASSITEATIYNGEHYDARLEQTGWSTPRFRPDKRWQAAVDAPPAAGALVAAIVPPIRRQEMLKPIKVVVLADGASVVDFGQNFTGWSRIQVRGRRGQAVSLRYAELLNADGSVDQTNLREARATDVYTIRGSGEETYEPRFTYHGFRYVQVEGLGTPLKADRIVGIPIRSDIPETGDLTLGSYVPQRLWINSRWSQRSNFMGIPTDCPQRDERLGWTGDAHVFWDAASFNMDTAAFTQRFMTDMRDAQRGKGDFPDFAPNANHERFNGPGSSPGWGDAGIALPWTVWQRYGDTAIIDQNWTAMERFIESIRSSNPDLIWSKGRGADYADWLALDAVQPGDPTTPKDLVGTAMWKGAIDQMVDMAQASGRAADAGRYARMSKDMAAAFRRRFVRPDNAIGNGSQTGYILALHFDLLGTAQRPEAVRRLVADIRRRGTLLSTGFLGTPYSLDVLADAGEVGLVYDLLLRTQFPSWGYMIAKGATTTWERWNSDAGDRSMNSFNHYALGAVVGFMFRRIAGIAPLAPGFTEFEVNPVFDPRVPTAGATYDARIGRIMTKWSRSPDGAFKLDLLVPPNATALVTLPARALSGFTEGGAPAGKRIDVVKRHADGLNIRVPSGRYSFAA